MRIPPWESTYRPDAGRNDGTSFGLIGIDISDINTDDHLTLSEIGSNEFFDWFRPEIEFEAELGLVFGDKFQHPFDQYASGGRS